MVDISWRKYVVEELPNKEIVIDIDFKKEENQLLDWASKTSFLNVNIEESTLDLPYGKIYSYSAEGFSQTTKEQSVGSGKSISKRTAAAKAIGELIERIVGSEIMSDLNMESSHRIVIENESFKIDKHSKLKKMFEVPGLRTSNGWAVHFNLHKAIYNAVLEALERHILIYSFLKDSWRGFRYYSAPVIEGFQTGSLFSVYEFGGFRAGIAIVHSKKYPGFTMGYLCDKKSKFSKSMRWESAFLEGFEPVLFFESNPLHCQDDIKFGFDILAKYQRYYLLNDRPDWNMICSDTETKETISKIESNICVFDLKKAFNLEFSFYAAYCSGGAMIPLILKENLKEHDIKVLTKLLGDNGLFVEIPEIHPIV